MGLITEQFLITQGWKRTNDLSELAFTKSGFTLEIEREADSLQTIIYDEYGFHDGMCYRGATPTEEQYRTLVEIIDIKEIPHTVEVATYTPGPWEIRYLTGTDMEVRGPEYGQICKLSGLSHSVELMDEYGPTEVANANLIASAPDLLERVKGMLESYNLCMAELPEGWYKDRIRGYFNGEPEKAIAAIRKAEGAK
jgi:hypothetical protein